MDKMTCITPGDLASARTHFAQDPTALLARNAASSVGIRAAARVPEAVAANSLDFDLEVTQGKRCDQQRSGRCWMFASLNTTRVLQLTSRPPIA